MESRSGMYSGAQSGGFALEMSLRRSTPPRNPNPNQSAAAAGVDGGNYIPGYQFGAKSKSPNLVPSDDDEFNNSGDDNNKKSASPWQRMKWTHNMVRLLIMVVFYVGDEAVGTDGNDKKKKGKWKTVSRVMTKRGFNVSPQQCEDKFNDLNKRYKRVNDLLGKGMACRVVEDQTLLDGMDHLSAKTKDEVRKMINSKHLFFREMCAYHNSCGHGPGNDRCVLPEVEVKKTRKARMGNPSIVVSDDDEDDDFRDDDDEEEEDDDDDDVDDGDDNDEYVDEYEVDEVGTKRARREMSRTGFLIRGLENEMANVLEDGRKSVYEKREWLKAKQGQLEEDRMVIRSQAFEMEKQRLKWLKFSAKKEMEMEKERLANERMKLENDRLMLFVRKQELGLIERTSNV